MRKIHPLTLALSFIFLCMSNSYCLMEQLTGPQPEAYAQPSSPAGIVELLRHESRIYSVWVNGNENIYYSCTPEQINKLITLYSKTRLRDHIITIKEGADFVKPYDSNEIPFNVQLHILEGIALHVHRGKAEPITYEPTLTVHVPKDADEEFYGKITIPPNIIIKSEAESCPLKSEIKQPERKTWYAQIQFDGNKPAVDFESGLSTTITFWEQGEEHGINLGKVTHEGYFSAAFSENEMDDLRNGKSWLTMTVGNYLTESKKNHPRLDINALYLSKASVEPIFIGKPGLYYGRILFEDDTPPIVPDGFWQGAEITVNFPYAGQPTIDKEGYFEVFFTPDQFEAMKERKERKNIYIPVFEEKNTGRAEHIFPVTKLSTDKSTAGVVKIPKPGPAQE